MTAEEQGIRYDALVEVATYCNRLARYIGNTKIELALRLVAERAYRAAETGRKLEQIAEEMMP